MVRMQENTSKAVVINSLVLYGRLIVVSLCGLFATRFALQALGVRDFGIFAVVGSLISFITIINSVMVATSNRFLSVAVGKGDIPSINRQFNINLFIHIVIAIVILLLSFPVGNWYILNYVNYEGNINNIVNVFDITILGTVFSVVGVPYNGLLMAKERFWVFCLPDMICNIIKVGLCYLLIYYFDSKLYVYTVSITLLAALPTFFYVFYCIHSWSDLVKIKWIKDKKDYKAVLSFSLWVGYGAIAHVAKAQGAALIVNAFFNTVMNAALGLANTINHLVILFSQNVAKSISPQITKSYAAGDFEKSTSLACLSSKVSFLFMLIVSSPFLLTPQYVLEIWLGKVPDYAVIFSVLMIIDALVGSLNAGIPELVFATGRIKWYQIITNTLFLLSVAVAFFVLKSGAPAYALIVTYIIFSIIVLIVRQIVLNKLTSINNWLIIKKSYIPSLLVLVLYLPLTFFHPSLHPLLLNLLSIFYLLFLVLIFGFNNAERMKMRIMINKIKNKY